MRTGIGTALSLKAWRRYRTILVLAAVALFAAACTDDGPGLTDDGAPWTIDDAVEAGFVKVDELQPGPAKVVEAWAGTFNGARVELYRHGLDELGVERPADPTWLHRRTLEDDCCNFWQRNRLTAVCAREEQACRALREALEAAGPL